MRDWKGCSAPSGLGVDGGFADSGRWAISAKLIVGGFREPASAGVKEELQTVSKSRKALRYAA